MRRAFFILVAVFLYLYGKEAYLIVQQNVSPVHLTTGNLSDIAVSVHSITLQPTGDDTLSRFTRIRQSGRSVFTVFNGVLYHYNLEGQLLGRITDPSVIEVAEYMIDTAEKRLIVLGNEDDIQYYSFEGELLSAGKYQPESEWERILSVACYEGRIWMARELLVDASPDYPSEIVRQLVEYDTSFVERSIRDLSFAPVGRDRGIPLLCNASVSISRDTGEVYVYAPSPETDHLLQDTLFIANFRDNRVVWNNILATDSTCRIFPVAFTSRIWLASYSDPEGNYPGYLFCYDRHKKESRLLLDGLKDDFFHTGQIRHLTPVDVFNETYCYTREKEGSTTVYMVQLKG